MPFTVFQRVVAGEPPKRARHPTERLYTLINALGEPHKRTASISSVYSLPGWRPASPPSARHPTQRSGEGALVAFTVLRGVAAGEPPKPARHPTEP